MDLLIVGASARAAAFSALRAGFRPTCIDLFADQDLALACPASRIEPSDYPEGLAVAAESISPRYWLYTGGLENHPDLVDRISKHHKLSGNPGAVLRAVRDPIPFAEALRQAGCDVPEVRLDPQGLPADGSWLRKPIASAGGRAIRPWMGGAGQPGRFYYQRRIEGLSFSALFLGEENGTGCLGLTRQFVGRPVHRFAYRGTLAPWPVSDDFLDRVVRIGQSIATIFGVSGLFGVDLIEKDGRPWPIEINPRYTAAVEALEWASGRSFLALRNGACGIDPPDPPTPLVPEGVVGKVILYADRSFTWNEPDLKPWPLGRLPEIADVPHIGTRFEPGDPVLTVLAHGDNPTDCRRRLAERMRVWRRKIASQPAQT